MPRLILISLLFLAPQLMAAQQSDTTSQKSKTAGTATGAALSDSEPLAKQIRESYYHPDELSGLNCTVSVDWPAFFEAMKVTLPPDRLKIIQGLIIRSEAVRQKTPNITFEWAGGALDNKEQFEDGLKQMVGGFYQMYWSMIASPPIGKAAEITKIEPIPDGGAKVYSSAQNSSVVITVDKDNIPTHYTFDIVTIKGTIDPHYISSPKPIPGDIRRISSMDVSEQIGSSTINVKVGLDYQALDEFYVPGHVSYDVGGAYSLSMAFTGCSASKAAAVSKIN